ncbi:SGNH/GDSL hydrolase family protein [Streptomyces litchfieldiae]|uniref:GDSL-type esterase/lipase family protein n=1 Tax=Streptomyces litchfieldiae TaxID=3075543 RepID=A0ABU2MX68_9ACTN|nr:GDSL-type esterase/lipase family protein [Streptomyces sp. DSM 44938]MDT0346252.1 GDSL-type esterase/lipase family protein [Streptomyces sp. DSM 44938]
MPVSRRTLALPIAAVALLAACTSSSGDSAPDAAGATAGGSPESGGAGDAGPQAEAAPEWDTSPESIAAIGDSITRAFDACSLLADCPEASWATGTDASVASLAQQLLGDGPEAERHSWNLAESGATVADLPAQAREAVAHEPQLVTVLIGGNDACASDLGSMTSAADFRADFTETMDIIRGELPETQVYVSSVPDLMRLWSEGSESLMARAVWQMANICPSMLSDAGDDSTDAAERREAVRERVTEYNEVLADVCGEDALCRYDGGAVFEYDFTTHHLSDYDWFHPSREGQSTLAALAYEQVTMAE